jgi:FixJ family two-component response regulator
LSKRDDRDPVDPIHDAVLALIDAGLDAAEVTRVLGAVRQRWQGQCYVRTRDPITDEEINRRIAAGEPARRIAKDTGVHVTTIVRRRSRWL